MLPPRGTIVAVLLLVLTAVVVLLFNTRTAQAQGDIDSTDAELSALSLSPGTLDPAFDRLTNSYTASVEHPESPITLIATASDPANATVEFLDGDDMTLADADGAAAGHQVDLAPGENTIKVKVTAGDGLTTRTYTLVVTREPSTDLSDLRVNGVSVPGFDSDVNYTPYGVQRGVAASVTQATIEGVAADPDASVAYVGTDAADATDGHQVNLSEGRNEVSIVVTSADGIRTRTYVLSVNRGSDAPFGWRAQDDFDTLLAAGVEGPEGLWSDGTTMWVGEDLEGFERLFAFALDTRLHDPDKDFDTLRSAGNMGVRGICRTTRPCGWRRVTRQGSTPTRWTRGSGTAARTSFSVGPSLPGTFGLTVRPSGWGTR